MSSDMLKLANSYWNIKKHLYSNNEEETVKIKKSLNTMMGFLKENGYDIVDVTGRIYQNDSKEVEVINSEIMMNSHGSKMIISDMVLPIVVCNEEIIQKGKVVIISERDYFEQKLPKDILEDKVSQEHMFAEYINRKKKNSSEGIFFEKKKNRKKLVRSVGAVVVTVSCCVVLFSISEKKTVKSVVSEASSRNNNIEKNMTLQEKYDKLSNDYDELAKDYNSVKNELDGLKQTDENNANIVSDNGKGANESATGNAIKNIDDGNKNTTKSNNHDKEENIGENKDDTTLKKGNQNDKDDVKQSEIENNEDEQEYIVQSGDTISKICNKFELNYKDNKEKIIERNSLESEDKIYEGQKIYLPKE